MSLQYKTDVHIHLDKKFDVNTHLTSHIRGLQLTLLNTRETSETCTDARDMHLRERRALTGETCTDARDVH